MKKLLPYLLVLISTAAFAQSEVNIRVQVNRLPQGSYPTKLYQFNAMPGLVTVTLTNRTSNSYMLFLTGAVTGDNGVKVTTAKGYQPTSIELKPLETKILNAIEAGSLFDPNHLVFLNGNTSIKSSVFGEQGLPEGSYQICVRAFNASTKAALSEEDPMGCSNIFTITTLEPPMILNPFHESLIRPEPVQNIPFRWTTPPGAPPSTEYRIRIVELFNNRNPNDAILSTPTPFFETTIRGTPLLLYSMQYPRLQEGRSYAMMVIANDPLGNATFRNNGRSEVVKFTYSNNNSQAGVNPDGSQPTSTEYATNRLKGRLVWTFKKSELGGHNLYLSSGGVDGSIKVQQSDMVKQNNSVVKALAQQPAKSATAITANTMITSYAGNQFANQLALTPLIQYNSLAAVNKDNTLLKNTSVANTYVKTTAEAAVKSPIIALPTNILSASQAMETNCSYETILPDSAADRFGMPNVNFTLSAIQRTGNGNMAATNLLATGQTDQEGNFSIDYLHPSYASNPGAAELVLSIQSSDFENTSFRLPGTVLTGNNTFDVGNLLLLAKTYRFFPKVVFPESDDVNKGSFGYHIYRDADEVDARPWLLQEGMGKGAKKNIQIVDGRRVIEIASDTITLGKSSTYAMITSLSTLDAKGTGRIFLGGNLYVKIYPSGSSFYNLSSVVSVFNSSVASNKILIAKATYKLSVKPSHIAGRVAMFMDDQGSIPIPGATVRIMYKKADVVPTPSSPLTSLADRDIYQVTSAASFTKYVSGWSDYNVHDPGVTSLQAVAYGISSGGMSQTPSVLVTQPAGSSKLSAQLVTNVSAIFAEPVSQVPDDSKAVTVTTDATGNYYAGNLPLLHPGKNFLVEVINVPYEFRTFVVRPKSGGPNPVPVSLGKGISKIVDFTVDADVADVVGRIVDAQGKPLANARISFKGTILTQTGPEGIFQFKIYPGNHTLSLEKEGYVIKTTTINIQQLTGSSNEESSYKSQWVKMSMSQKHAATLSRISQSPTVQAAVSQGKAFNAVMFGMASDNKASSMVATEFNASLAAAFGMPADAQTPQYEMPRKFAVDVKDIGYLNKITGKVRFRLVDEAANTTRIAGATIQLFDTSHVTDNNGEWYYEGFGGATTVIVTPPANTAYVPEQNTFTLTETGVEEVIVIKLKKGVKVSGKVVSGNQPLANARIIMDEKEFISITTDAQGNYTVYTTAGEHSFGARKQNYVGQDKSEVIPAAGAVIDFNLKGGGTKNYGTLLGFAIELSSTEVISAKQEKWSGAFINLKAANPAFDIKENIRIPFNNITVEFNSRGDALPAEDKVKTDLTSLPIKLFGYLPVKLQTNDVITFMKTDNGGELAGNMQVDFSAIQGYRGWSISNAVPLLLAKEGSTVPEKIIVFSSATQSATPITKFQLLSANNAKASGQLYGFTINVSSGIGLDQHGCEIRGTIGTPALGPVKSMQIGLKRLFLNKALVVGAVEVQTTDLPSLEIAGWRAAISNLVFNEDGFRLGGNIAVAIPRSDSSRIRFNDLAIAPTGMFGGSFIIPETGINIFHVANLNSGGVPLSFGRVGNSNVYRLGGKASLKINVDIMSKSFDVPLFEVMTNGDFSVQVPANYNTNIGPFGFSVSNIYMNSKDNAPFIGVQGGFRADLDFLKFEVADIKITASGGGVSWSLEKLGVKLDVPVLKTEAFVKFNKEGFEGGGKVSIAGTPIGGDINFKYYKRSWGIEMGANFFANIPPIPIGVLVTLDGIGGGFEYKSGGPNGGFSVDVRGKLSFLGTGPAVALNPVGLTVSSAGILKGYGDVEIATYMKVGHAEMVFNGPDRTFQIQINAQIEPIKGLAKQAVQGALVISAKPNDEFAFLGCAVQVKLLGLIDNHGEMAIGIRVKNPKTRGDLVSHYFEYAPEDYMRESFSGVYINTSTEMGIPEHRPLEFDLFIASAKIWCSTAFQASLLLNLDEQAFRIRFGGKFSAGVEACVADIACVNISAGLCYLVEGGRNDSQGWNFGATATGQASLGFGIGVGDCSPGCNEVVTVWDGCIGGAFKVCGAASLDFGFSERDGVRFKVRAGGNVNPCF